MRSMNRVFDILPFSFLDAPARETLRQGLTRIVTDAGDTVVRQGSLTDRRVFLLVAGAVHVIDHHEGPDAVVLSISPGHWFGERAALLGTPRAFEFRAAEDETELYALESDTLLTLVAAQPAFAAALALQLRQKHALFADFDRFVAAVRQDASSGHLHLPTLLPLYHALAPALHPGLHSEQPDLGALGYALARLPEGLTSTFAWFLTEDMPFLYDATLSDFTALQTPARRRAAWRMMSGKTLVLLRDGLSDLLDFVTCLCLYAVEARKLRRILQHPAALSALKAGEIPADPRLPASMGDRLSRAWPGAVPERLRELVLHHEDMVIGVYREIDNYNASHSERWTRQLAEATERLLGVAPSDLPADFPITVISSNTHSVTNCLSPWLHQNAELIRHWGATHAPQLHAQPWPNPEDQLVALARVYLDAHPEEASARDSTDACTGSVWLKETAYTGISVQLFDLSAINARQISPQLPQPSGKAGLLVNIDYAFGQQADPIVANLVALFGKRLRAVHVLGKAGGLVGLRGEILLAESFIVQGEDSLQVVPDTLSAEVLAAALPGRAIHRGRVLTVAGTVLQNVPLLHYYRNLWQCVGLEMEGSWYARQLSEARILGIVRQDLRATYTYYISDCPLHPEQTLQSGLGPVEGIPPLYAATRAVLAEVLAG